MKEKGHEFVCSDDKEGPGSVFQKHIVDVSPHPMFMPTIAHRVGAQAEVLITTPFHPGYLTRELIEMV